MKKVLLTLTAMIIVTLSVDAQKLRKNEVDDFTGYVKKYTNYYNAAKTDVGLLKASVLRIDDFVALKINSTSDLGCSGASGNYIIFKFTDGTSYRMDADKADIDCADDATSMYIIKKDNPLNHKVLSKIRLRMSEYYTDGVVYGTYTIKQLLDAVK
jgi:hypothetical protein